jgi:hypothetical protein
VALGFVVVTGTTFLIDAALLGCHSPRRRIVEQPDPWCLRTRQLPCRARAGVLTNFDRWALALVTGVYEPRTFLIPEIIQHFTSIQTLI